MDVIAAGTHLPASFCRRRGPFVRDCCGNAPSGVEMAPERGHRTPRPRERALRREAPGATTRGDTHSRPEPVSTCAGHTFGHERVSVGARAGVGRRGARASGASAFPCGRGNAPSGEKSTPEGLLWTGLLREPVSRRVFLAGGSLMDVIAAITRSSAPKWRRSGNSVRRGRGNAPSGERPLARKSADPHPRVRAKGQACTSRLVLYSSGVWLITGLLVLMKLGMKATTSRMARIT